MLRCGPAFIAACRRRYGPTFTLRVATMGTIVYLTDPADIKTVFAGDPHVYHAGEANSILEGLLGSTSVLVIDEDAAPRAAPADASAVRPRRGRGAGSGDRADRGGATSRPGRSAQTFPAAPEMSAITLEVILRTVIGASDPARLAALREVLPQVLNVGPWQSLAIANRDLLRRRPWRRLREAMAEADRLLYAEIADRRADPGLAGRTDALAMLVRAGGR